MTKQDKARLRAFYEHKDLQILLRLKNWVRKQWQEENVIGENEFQTLQFSLAKEYKTKALDEFFKLWEQMAFDDAVTIKEEDNDGEL